MNRPRKWQTLLPSFFLATILAFSADKAFESKHPLDSTKGLQLVGATAEIVNYRGRRALHLIPQRSTGGEDMLAILSGSGLRSGIIEADMVGLPRQGTPADMRGFIGLAFRLRKDNATYENIFLRPLNARADDQLRRNHTIQYQSVPEYPWNRLRQESPAVYESYCDMEPGAWTHLRIEFEGTHARAYVNHAAQPCLVVNDLKLGDAGGAIALWANGTTDAYFSVLTVERK